MTAHLEETGTAQDVLSGTRASDTVTLSSASQVAGRLTMVIVIASHGGTYSGGVGEGWTVVKAVRSSGPFVAVTALLKVWGLGGQTDDSTPTFSFGSTNAKARYYPIVFSNPAHATSPWANVAAALVASATDNAIAATATPAAPSATDTGSERTIVRAWVTGDDNTLNANSEGTFLFNANLGTDTAGAATCLEGTTTSGSTGTATVTESTNGNDAGAAITLVLTAPAFVATLGPPPQSRTRRLLPILVR